MCWQSGHFFFSCIGISCVLCLRLLTVSCWKMLQCAELKHCNRVAQTNKQQPAISINYIHTDSEIQGTKTMSTLMRAELPWGLENIIYHASTRATFCTTPQKYWERIPYTSCRLYVFMQSCQTHLKCFTSSSCNIGLFGLSMHFSAVIRSKIGP